MPRTVNVAVLGCGMMGQEHISYMAGYDHVNVKFLCDPAPSSINTSLELCKENGVSTMPEVVDEVDLLARVDEFDLLVIASPNYMHTPTLLRWGKQNVNILCEKPVAVNKIQVQELKAAAPDFHANIWIAMEYRYIPAVQKLLQLKERVGDIKMVTIRENRYPFLSKVGEWNKNTNKTGDTLVEKCCHFFDLFRLITEQEVQACNSRIQRGLLKYREGYEVKEDVQIIDSAYVVMDFDGPENTTGPVSVSLRERTASTDNLSLEPEHIFSSAALRSQQQTIGCLELCMFAEGSRHQEEIIVTGMNGRLEAYMPENKVWSFTRPHDTTWPDKSKPPPTASIQEEIVDCGDLKEVYDFADEIPHHAGYHYCSTAVEWKYLLDAVERVHNGELFAPQVSLADGIAAVEMGILATHSINRPPVVSTGKDTTMW